MRETDRREAGVKLKDRERESGVREIVKKRRIEIIKITVNQAQKTTNTTRTNRAFNEGVQKFRSWFYTAGKTFSMLQKMAELSVQAQIRVPLKYTLKNSVFTHLRESLGLDSYLVLKRKNQRTWNVSKH